MFKHAVKTVSAAFAQKVGENVAKSYVAVTSAAKNVPQQVVQGVGLGKAGVNPTPGQIEDVLNDKFSAHPEFLQAMPKGFKLDMAFHFAFNPSTLIKMPLQGDYILKEGQNMNVEAFGWAFRDTVNKKIYIFFKGTVFKSTEIFASTGTNKLGFNNDDTVPASTLVKGMPGEVKGSNARWMSSRVLYIGEDGKERVLIESMANQMRDYARRKDLEGYDITLVAHSVGATELAVMYTEIGLADPKLLSALAFCMGPYRIFSKDAVQWMNLKAPGPWINLINGNDFVTLASTVWGSAGTALFTRPSPTEESIRALLKINSFDLPGQNFGFESRYGVGWNPVTNHLLALYLLSLNLENFGRIKPLKFGLESLLGFKSDETILSLLLPSKEEDPDLAKVLKLEDEGYINPW